MSYTGAMVLPQNAVIMQEEEMRYLEGGGSKSYTGKAITIRNRLSAIIGCALGGTGCAAAQGVIFGGPGSAAVAAVLGNAYFGSYRTAASKAHSKVETIIKKYGKNKKCKMTTTYSVGYYCTGITVKTV